MSGGEDLAEERLVGRLDGRHEDLPWVGAGDHVDAWPEKVKHFSIVLSKIWLDRL